MKINSNTMLNQYTLHLDLQLPTLNDFINIEKRVIQNSVKKKFSKDVMMLAKSENFKLPKGKFDVKCIWNKLNNRCDHDGITFGLKIILDALTPPRGSKKYGLGILEEDNSKHINFIYHEFTLNRSLKYRTVDVVFTKID